jgi:hypothetical protein
MTGFALCLILAIPYFFPTIVAIGKGGRSSYVISMFILNLLVGWTFIGWWFILICAANVKPVATPVTVVNVNPPIIPAKSVDQRFNWFAPTPPPLPNKEVVAVEENVLIKSGERFDFATQKWVATYTTKVKK